MCGGDSPTLWLGSMPSSSVRGDTAILPQVLLRASLHVPPTCSSYLSHDQVEIPRGDFTPRIDIVVAAASGIINHVTEVVRRLSEPKCFSMMGSQAVQKADSRNGAQNLLL